MPENSLPPRPGSEKKKRWEALDDLRGLAVLVMVPVNVAAQFTAVPAWFKHAPASGLTVADFVVPVFLFSLGLSASLSFARRIAKDGLAKTFLHALARCAALFVFGLLGILLVDHENSWEILQMLGATGLFSFFFLFLSPWPRLAAAGLLLAGVEVLRPLGLGALMRGWYDTGIAGPWGTFSLSFFAISASALGEMMKDRASGFRVLASAAMALLLAIGGLVALRYQPFSKHLLSLSYVLFTGGAASGLLALCILWRETLRWPLPLVGSLGRNPLLLYMLHSVLGVLAHALLSDDVSAPIAWSTSLAILALCCAVARVLDDRKLYVRL